ncbi:DUF2017 family protein [Microbacterium sp. NPDC091313]
MSAEDRTLIMEVTTIEAAHLHALVAQFVDLLDATDAAAPDDPALARLVPDAYPGDREASAEFRRLTAGDILGRRGTDARLVTDTLERTGPLPEAAGLAEDEAVRVCTLTLSAEESEAWLRTLAAVRLVLASRLGIQDEDDRADEDPRFLLYDWLGARLEAMIAAVDRGR